MSTHTTLRTRLANRLADPSHAIWSTDALDEALRTALHDYSQALPLTTQTAITLPGHSFDVALNDIAGLLSVLGAWWPYDALYPWSLPDGLSGFRLWWDDAQPVLRLATVDRAIPRACDAVLLIYGHAHAIEGLDGADFTSFFSHHESGLLTGAAGYAATMEHVDQAGQVRLDPNEARTLAGWSGARLKEFRAWLASLRTGPGPSGKAFSRGWALDKWDR